VRIIETHLPGCVVIEPAVHGDERGYFYESFNAHKFAENGFDLRFVQTNISRSARGVLRGLHYQWPNPQGKLVSVVEGEVYDVAVDIRHGFVVLSDDATFLYQCTAHYDRAADAGVRWNDGEIAVDWPVAEPLLSDKDQRAPFLADIARDKLPTFQP